MWKCPECGEQMDEQFEACWKCQQAKPDSPTTVSGEPEPWAEWHLNFVEQEQPDGFQGVEVFGHRLTCGVCGNASFRKRSLMVNQEVATIFQSERAAVNYVCSRCGYLFWFLDASKN